MGETRELQQLVHEVANVMTAYGESWVLMPGPGKRGFGTDMVSHRGEHVNFQEAAQPGRLVIEACDPLTAWAVAKPITVAASRPPLAIAREIVSRLLPGAREELASRRAKEAKARAAFDARAAAVNAAEALFGTPSDFGEFDPTVTGERHYKTEARLALRGKHNHQAGQWEHTETEFARVEVTGSAALMNLTVKDVPTEVVMRMLAVLAAHNAAMPVTHALWVP